jgi:hypothetical protein
VQAEARGHAEVAHELAVDGGADGLAGVLDHRQLPAPRDLEDRAHLGGLSRVVHRQQRPGARGDGGLDLPGVDVEVVQHVDEHRARARLHDGPRGGDEGIGGRDHLVAGSHPERLQREKERVGSRPDPDGVPGAAEASEALLELGHRRAQRELGGFEQALDVAKDRLGVGELLAEVRIGNAHA